MNNQTYTTPECSDQSTSERSELSNFISNSERSEHSNSSLVTFSTRERSEHSNSSLATFLAPVHQQPL